ncbi:hypothetical protein ALC56_09170, partial [Trachymyrmex septentrionalis]
ISRVMHASANRDQRYGARHPVGLCLTLNQPKGTGQQFRFIYDVAVMVVAELHPPPQACREACHYASIKEIIDKEGVESEIEIRKLS